MDHTVEDISKHVSSEKGEDMVSIGTFSNSIINSFTTTTIIKPEVKKGTSRFSWVKKACLYIFVLVFGFSMFGVLIYVVGVLNTGNY